MEQLLEISLLGEIITRLDDKRLGCTVRQKEIALLAYLAHTGRVHGREALADL